MTSHMEFTAGLNPQQQQAVIAGPGPVLVLAGPGSGKTRVLTTRIVHMIQSGIAPEAIRRYKLNLFGTRGVDSGGTESAGGAGEAGGAGLEG